MPTTHSMDAFSPSPPSGPVGMRADLVIGTQDDLPIIGELNQHAASLPGEKANDCWNKIGVKGDRSCPELQKYVHCRNCPVFSNAGQRLFERQPPAGHLAEWTKRLAEPESVAAASTLPVLIFRVGEEWLAIDISLLIEIAEPRPIHTIPHRSNHILVGLVNIRGELDLCISLSGLLGIESSSSSSMAAMPSEVEHHSVPSKLNRTSADEFEFNSGSLDGMPPKSQTTSSVASQTQSLSRLMVVSRADKRWVFQVDEVEGVARFTSADVTNVPSTVSGSFSSFTKGLFWSADRRIGYLDESRLLETLERSLA